MQVRRNSLQCKSMGWIIHFICLLCLGYDGLYAADVGNSDCPTGWIGNGKSCFYVSDYLTTWDVARNYCRLIGSDLVSIDNESVQQEFVSFLPQSDWFLKGFWIGLNDLEYPGIFEWVDGTAITYTDWLEEIPEWNAENSTGNCVALDIDSLKWKILNCTEEQGFICGSKNMTLPLATANVERCDESEMKSFLGSCYWTVPGSNGWIGADKWCGTEGGSLATISNSLENIFLYEMVGTGHSSHWIGLRVDDNGSPKWVAGEAGNYTNWDGEPSKLLNVCAAMERHGRWMLQPCESQIPNAICEKNPAVSVVTELIASNVDENSEIINGCKIGWTRNGENCYLVVRDPLTWEGARNECVSLQGELVHLTSREDEESVLNLIADAVDNSTSSTNNNLPNFWLGLFNTSTQTGLRWSDGAPVIYSNWKFTSPIGNISSTDELLCGSFEITFGQWSNALCSLRFPFICQAQVRISSTNNSSCEDGMTCQTTSDALPEETTINDVCPPRGKNLGDKCYFFIGHYPSHRTNWSEASLNCKKIGGDLVSIHSESEYAFVLKNMDSEGITRVWTGLRNAAGQLQYTDNSPVNFANWSTFEGPYVQKTGCVKIETQAISGKWVTADCRVSMAYICQTIRTDGIISITTTLQPLTEQLDSSTTTTTTITSDFSDDIIIGYQTTQSDDDETLPTDQPSSTTTTNDQVSSQDFTPDQTTMPEDPDDTETSNDGLVTVQCSTSRSAMTGGAIAGIVLSCILGTAFVIVLTLYIHQRRVATQFIGGKFSFDNALYNPHGDHIQLDTNMPNR